MWTAFLALFAVERGTGFASHPSHHRGCRGAVHDDVIDEMPQRFKAAEFKRLCPWHEPTQKVGSLDDWILGQVHTRDTNLDPHRQAIRTTRFFAPSASRKGQKGAALAMAALAPPQVVDRLGIAVLVGKADRRPRSAAAPRTATPLSHPAQP